MLTNYPDQCPVMDHYAQAHTTICKLCGHAKEERKAKAGCPHACPIQATTPGPEPEAELARLCEAIGTIACPHLFDRFEVFAQAYWRMHFAADLADVYDLEVNRIPAQFLLNFKFYPDDLKIHKTYSATTTVSTITDIDIIFWTIRNQILMDAKSIRTKHTSLADCISQPSLAIFSKYFDDLQRDICRELDKLPHWSGLYVLDAKLPNPAATAESWQTMPIKHPAECRGYFKLDGLTIRIKKRMDYHTLYDTPAEFAKRLYDQVRAVYEKNLEG